MRVLLFNIEKKNNELQSVLDELNSDLEAAGKMQRSLLPDPDMHMPGFKFAWFFEPCTTIGGDLINVMPLDETHLALYIMDVSGHGIQSAMLAVSVHRMLSAWGGENSVLRTTDGYIRRPNDVVTELNREFPLQKNNYQYFTMTYGLLNLEENSFCYCRAGHTPLLLQKSDGEVIVKSEGNLPVGFSEDGNYNEYKIYLQPGERIILFSDGITEARHKGAFFGDERFFNSLKRSRALSPARTVDAVVGSVKGWLRGESATDDVTLMVLEADKP